MEFFINENGYFPFNILLEERLKVALPNEKHLYKYKGNQFPIKIAVAEDDFIVKPIFKNSKKGFEEIWLLYPYTTKTQVESAFVIKSNEIQNMEELLSVFNLYGFKYTGKVDESIFLTHTLDELTDYLRENIPVYTKFKVDVFFNKKTKSWHIQNYFKNSNRIVIYMLEDGYWFIPLLQQSESFAAEISKTVQYLLNHYDFITVFGEKKKGYKTL